MQLQWKVSVFSFPLIFPVIPHKIKCALGSIFREFINTSFKSDSVFFGSIISPNAQLYIFYNSMHKINVCATKFVCCYLMLSHGSRAVPWDSQHNHCNDWVSSVYQRERRLWVLPSVIIPCLSPRHLLVLLQSTSSNLPLQTAVLLLLLLRSLQSPSPSLFVFLLYKLSQLLRMI